MSLPGTLHRSTDVFMRGTYGCPPPVDGCIVDGGRWRAAVCAVYRWPATLTDDEILARLLALNLKRAGQVIPAVVSGNPCANMQDLLLLP
jgi:hypothetical protein